MSSSSCEAVQGAQTGVNVIAGADPIPFEAKTVDDIIGKIHHGDCLKGLMALPDGCVPLVWTDPPFNICYKYDQYDDDRETADYLTWCESWIAQVHRVLTDAGTFWLMIGPKFVSELDVLCKRLGFHKRAQVNWYVTFGVSCRNNFGLSNTYLLYYTKSKTNFHFDQYACRVPSARQFAGDKRANPDGKLPDDTWILRPQDVSGFGAYATTWHCPRVAGTFKSRQPVPTHTPEQVVGRCIRICSKPGDLVLDCFSGSGTTPTVAKKLGRRFVGFELSPDYCLQSMVRLSAAKEGDPLDTPDIQEVPFDQEDSEKRTSDQDGR